MSQRLLSLLCFAAVWMIRDAIGVSLLPYGAHVGDDLVPRRDDSSSGSIPLQIDLLLFGTRFSELWVNTNGVISFGRQVTAFTPTSFPLSWGVPLVAVFWGDVDIRNHGRISYRESIAARDLSAAQRLIDEHASQIFRSFQVEMVFVATWDDVAAFGVRQSSINNTFQCVLMTDGRMTLAAFIYEEIDWTTGTASGGNRSGLGGVPAQVGFDAGDGVRYHAIPESRTSAVVNLPRLSNVNTPGLFIYRIDGGSFGNGTTCTGGEDGVLGVSPLYSPLVGGTMLTVMVGEECLQDIDTLACVFHSSSFQSHTDVTPAKYVSATSVRCVSPPFHVSGRATLGLSFDGGNSTFLRTSFFFLATMPSTMAATVNGQEIARNADVINLFGSNETLTLTWDTDEVNDETLDLIAMTTDEDGAADAFYLVAEGIADNGTFDISANDLNESLSEAGIGTLASSAFRLALVPSEPSVGGERRRLWAPLIGLAARLIVPAVRMIRSRFFERALRMPRWSMRVLHRQIMSLFLCSEPFWTNFLDYDFSHLGPVPCTAQMAASHPDWTVDPHCPNANDCSAHEGTETRTAICFRGPTHADGSCHQVCYTEDGSISTDRTGAGTADRVCGSGSWWAHGFWDGVPYAILSACDNLDLYLEHRPNPDPSNCFETVPPPAATRGDPHFVTLSGLPYTFNGLGEFWYLQADGLDIQVRMEDFGTGAATVLTSVVVKMSSSRAIQVGFPSRARDTLQVLAGGEVQTFDSILTTQEFDDVIVEVPVGMTPAVKVNVPGVVQVEIIASNGALGLVIRGMESLNRTYGLIGAQDGLQGNSLVTANGTRMPINASSRQLHYDFGLSWMLYGEQESLFTYRGTQSFQTFHHPSYTPQFMDEVLTNDTEVEAVCGSDVECIFDFVVTGSAEFAAQTLAQGGNFTRLVQVIEEARSATPRTSTTSTTTSAKTSLSSTSTSTSTTSCTSRTTGTTTSSITSASTSTTTQTSATTSTTSSMTSITTSTSTTTQTSVTTKTTSSMTSTSTTLSTASTTTTTTATASSTSATQETTSTSPTSSSTAASTVTSTSRTLSTASMSRSTTSTTSSLTSSPTSPTSSSSSTASSTTLSSATTPSSSSTETSPLSSLRGEGRPRSHSYRLYSSFARIPIAALCISQFLAAMLTILSD